MFEGKKPTKLKTQAALENNNVKINTQKKKKMAHQTQQSQKITPKYEKEV